MKLLQVGMAQRYRLPLVLSMFSGVNILVSFALHVYVIVRIGPGGVTDAFVAGGTLPQVILGMIGGPLSNVLVPLLAGDRKSDARRVATWIALAITGVFLVAAVVFAGLAPLWVPLLFPGFSESVTSTTVDLARIQMIGLPFAAAISVFSASYNARHRFVYAATVQLVVTVAALIALVVTLPRFGVYAAAWIFVARMVIQFLLLVNAVEIPTRVMLRDSHSPFGEAWRRLRPLLAGTAYYKAGPLLDRFLASLSPPGGLSLFNLAQQVYVAATQIVNAGLVAPALPWLSHHATAKDWSLFSGIVARRLKIIGAVAVALAIALPAALLLVFPFVDDSLMLNRQDMSLLLVLFIALSGFVIANALGQPLAAAFYATGDTRTPTRVGIVGFTAGAFLKVAGFFSWGLLGIAVAASIHQALNTLLLWLFQPKRRQ